MSFCGHLVQVWYVWYDMWYINTWYELIWYQWSCDCVTTCTLVQSMYHSLSYMIHRGIRTKLIRFLEQNRNDIKILPAISWWLNLKNSPNKLQIANILQRTNISHLGKGKILFKSGLVGFPWGYITISPVLVKKNNNMWTRPAPKHPLFGQGTSESRGLPIGIDMISEVPPLARRPVCKFYWYNWSPTEKKAADKMEGHWKTSNKLLKDSKVLISINFKCLKPATVTFPLSS